MTIPTEYPRNTGTPAAGMTAWLTVADLKRFRESIADEAAQLVEQEFVEVVAELAKHSRSRASRKGWRTRKRRHLERVHAVAAELRAEFAA